MVVPVAAGGAVALDACRTERSFDELVDRFKILVQVWEEVCPILAQDGFVDRHRVCRASMG